MATLRVPFALISTIKDVMRFFAINAIATKRQGMMHHDHSMYPDELAIDTCYIHRYRIFA